MYYLGVDLGGTNIKAALVSENGEIVKEAAVPTNLPRTAQEVCDDIAALCLQLGAGEPVAGIGVGCPGTVCDGVVLYSNNLDWHDFAMADYLQAKTGLPVCLGNDANVAALGEALAGCAKGAQSAVILTLGTGVGAGVVLGGKLLTGYTSAASEAGHMVIADAPDAPLCTCGRRGCLEALASATALIRMTRAARRTHPESLLNTLAPTEADVNGRTVFDAAAQGDAAAKAVADTYIHHLAVGVANLINIFFPEVIGLSGGVANQGENLLKPLRAAAEPMVFGSAFAKKHTRITTCTLGYRAGGHRRGAAGKAGGVKHGRNQAESHWCSGGYAGRQPRGGAHLAGAYSPLRGRRLDCAGMRRAGPVLCGAARGHDAPGARIH